MHDAHTHTHTKPAAYTRSHTLAPANTLTHKLQCQRHGHKAVMVAMVITKHFQHNYFLHPTHRKLGVWESQGERGRERARESTQEGEREREREGERERQAYTRCWCDCRILFLPLVSEREDEDQMGVS